MVLRLAQSVERRCEMEPTKKAKGVEDFLESEFGRTTAIKADICAFCGEPALEFEDRLSEKEYSISGLCQRCQDKVFDPKAYKEGSWRCMR